MEIISEADKEIFHALLDDRTNDIFCLGCYNYNFGFSFYREMNTALTAYLHLPSARQSPNYNLYRKYLLNHEEGLIAYLDAELKIKIHHALLADAFYNDEIAVRFDVNPNLYITVKKRNSPTASYNRGTYWDYTTHIDSAVKSHMLYAKESKHYSLYCAYVLGKK